MCVLPKAIRLNKLRTLIKTEAELFLVAPDVGPEVERWIKAGQIIWEQREFAASDLDGVRLVYAATEDDDENARIAELAGTRGLLVSTEGTSPSLARALKSEFEQLLPSTLGSLANKINMLRAKVKHSLPDLSIRQTFWADIFDGRDLRSQLRVSEPELEARVDENSRCHCLRPPRLTRGARFWTPRSGLYLCR